MKKSESWHDASNPAQHGQHGPITVTPTVTPTVSSGRTYPLRDPVAAGWDELGVPALPGLDHNAGENLGRAQLCEARKDGLRQHAALCYGLEGVEVVVDTAVKKIVIERVDGAPRAVGVELEGGRVVKGAEVIVSAGVFKSPQLLMLSGIGPTAHLAEHGIETVVDIPEVGQNLHDHVSIYQFWKLKDPSQNLTLGSPNPIFSHPSFAKGVPLDWLVTTDVPHPGLTRAIAADTTDGAAPDPTTHPLLKHPRSHLEHAVLYMKLPLPGVAPDYAHLTTLTAFFLPTSRGSVSLRAVTDADADAVDAPRIEMNYLATAVDRYVAREGLRQVARMMLDTKAFGREYVAGETVIGDAVLGREDEGEEEDDDDDDEKLDRWLRMGATTTWHAAGTCAMGTVVDGECRVAGVGGLRVVDASVLPVPLSAHIQAAVYALAEQAAAIIAGRG